MGNTCYPFRVTFLFNSFDEEKNQDLKIKKKKNSVDGGSLKEIECNS